MSTNRKLTTICFAAALAFGLAACGGGGGSPSGTSPTPKTVDLSGVTAGYNALVATTHAIEAGGSANNGDVMFSCAAGGDNCTVMVANDGTVKSTGGDVTAANSAAYTKRLADQKKADEDLKLAQDLARLHGEASGATTDAKAAGAAAEQALKDAEKYDGELGTLTVNGDSGKAMANAQMVLDARDSANAAAQNATAAKTRAQTAKTEATALADSADKTALIAALDAAIKEADAQITATTGIRDGDDLKDAVREVTKCPSTGCTGNTKPKTAADAGKEVADAINIALNTSGQVPDVSGNVPATGTDNVMAGPSDAQGMTWEQIGGSALTDHRIAGTDANNNPITLAVKAKSVAGMTAAKVYTTFDNAPATTDGTQVDDGVVYKGIAGKLFCAGSDCKVENAVAGTFAGTSKLTGSWYFTPDSATATYIEGTGDDAGTYSLEAVDSYVRYGYWLTEDNNAAITINRYADGPDATPTTEVYAVNANVDAFKDKEAFYNGAALGMSVVKTFDSKGKELSRASGHFDADVSLTMKFGSNPSLEGTISNFSGSAVDTSWSVDLDNAALSSGAVGNGATDGGATTGGTWTATAWGGSNTSGSEARPKGVYGGFTAKFTNGDAAGVYATRR